MVLLVPLGQIHTDTHVHKHTSVHGQKQYQETKYMPAKGWRASGLTKTIKDCFCLAYLFVLCFIY